ncbi:hypothetical protein FHS20_003802 [Phyllobacterium endophyticum]|nr:hypothetical protein [Phyllobacterium endophyticum]
MMVSKPAFLLHCQHARGTADPPCRNPQKSCLILHPYGRLLKAKYAPGSGGAQVHAKRGSSATPVSVGGRPIATSP